MDDMLPMDNKHKFLEMMFLLLATWWQQGQRKGGGCHRCRKSTFFSLSSFSSSVSLRLLCSPNDNDNDDEVSRERYSKKITFDLFSHLINTIRISSSPNTYLYERNRCFYTRKRYFLYFPADQIDEIRISCSAPDQLTRQQVRVPLSGRTGTTPPAATGLQSVDNFHRGRSCTFRISIRKLCICVFRICASEVEVGGNKAVWMWGLGWDDRPRGGQDVRIFGRRPLHHPRIPCASSPGINNAQEMYFAEFPKSYFFKL